MRAHGDCADFATDLTDDSYHLSKMEGLLEAARGRASLQKILPADSETPPMEMMHLLSAVSLNLWEDSKSGIVLSFMKDGTKRRMFSSAPIHEIRGQSSVRSAGFCEIKTHLG